MTRTTAPFPTWRSPGAGGALLVALLLLALGAPAAATAADQPLTTYKHVSWPMERGAPGRINTLTQSQDGYLWIGSVDGLFRFDGVTFEAVAPQSGHRTHLVVSELLGARSGDLWVGLARSGGVAVYRGGRLVDAAMPHPSREVTSLAEDVDGSIWVARGGRTRLTLARYQRGRWDEIGPASGVPDGEVWQILVTHDGTMWLVMRDTILRRAPGAARFEPTGERIDRRASLAEDKAGRLWLSDTAGSRLLGGPAKPAPHTAIAQPSEVGGTRIRFDREGNLWGATWTGGVFHIQAAAIAESTARRPRAPVQVFRAVDGLTSDQTHAVFEDREGDIWIGTELGLDMLRPAAVQVEPAIPANSSRSYRMAATPDGAVYIADAHTVFVILPGRAPRPIFHSDWSPGALCAANGDRVWAPLRVSMVRIGGGHVETFPKPGETNALGCAEDAQGRLWIPGLEHGLYWRDGRTWRLWPGLTSSVGVPGNAARLADGRVAILFRTDPQLAGPTPFEALYRERFRVGGLEGVLPGRQSLFVSGADGFAELRGGAVKTLDATRYPWLASVNGLAQAPSGDTWIIGDAGITRFRTADLDAALAHPGTPLPHRTFDFLDGMNSFVQKAPGPQIEVGGDGRVWILSRRNVLRIDPSQLIVNTLPRRSRSGGCSPVNAATRIRGRSAWSRASPPCGCNMRG